MTFINVMRLSVLPNAASVFNAGTPVVSPLVSTCRPRARWRRSTAAAENDIERIRQHEDTENLLESHSAELTKPRGYRNKAI